MKNNRIGIIGTGYVGLVTGACLSKWYKVVCFDSNLKKVRNLAKGEAPFYEPGLDDLIKEGIESGNLVFTDDQFEMLKEVDTIFICVGTPNNTRTRKSINDGVRAPGKNCCNIEQVKAACGLIARHSDGKLVVIKSTVPPGTNNEMAKHLNSMSGTHRCASNPEFLREGTAVDDFMSPDRVVIGVRDLESLSTLLDIYSHIDADKLPMNVTSAEMSKYASNAALATKISFINEISNICEKCGANINAVKEVMFSDPRIGRYFYEQGPGFGGSCFHKDLNSLADLGFSHGINTLMLDAVIDTNKKQQLLIIDKIKKHLNLSAETKVAIWGAAFKPDTDDVRNSPTIPLVRGLLKGYPKVTIKVHDPKAIPNLKIALPYSERIQYYETNPVEMAFGSDVLVIVTPWSEYANIPPSQIGPIYIVDCRQLYTRDEVEDVEKVYESFGV